MSAITLQQLQDAQADALDLAAFINGPSGMISTRYGGDIPSLAKIIGDANIAIGAIEQDADAARDAAIAARDVTLGYRDDAAASAVAAAASAASVPAGAATNFVGLGPPGYNVGLTGASYYDQSNSVLYPKKTAIGWGAGISSPPVVSMPSTRIRVDFRVAGAAYPTAHWTFTRASQSTDLLFDDPYDFAFSTYLNDVPIMRAGAGYGHGIYMKAQQLLAHPAAPVNETLTLATGVYVATAWGPGGSNLQAVLGTATGSISLAGGNLAGNAKTWMVLTITASGTVNFLPTGGLTKANLVTNPNLMTITEPVPYIATQSTREADKAIGTATAIGATMFGAPAGYMLMAVSKVTGRSYSRSPTYLGLNGVSAGFFQNDNSVSVYDPANHITANGLGNGSAFAGTTIARTWDATASVTFGGGDRYETSHPYQYNNGVAVAAARLGGNSTADTYGAMALNGFIGWYEIDVAGRVADEALYNLYTSTALPTLDSLLKNYTGPSQFKKNSAALRLLLGGVVDHINWCIIGPSHEAGVAVGTNVRATAWSPQMVTMLNADADLIALGLEFNDDTFTGTNGNGWSANANPFDNRVTYTGAAPTFGGIQFGGDVIVIPDGTAVSFTTSKTSNLFELAYYTAAAGYGSLQVSIDGGATPIVPTGGGSATVSTAAAASLTAKTFPAASGMNTWTLKATGGPIHVALWGSRNTAKKQVMIYNGARSGYNVSILAQDAAPESSYALGVRYLAPSLSLGCGDNTNDMAGSGTDWGTIYNPKATAIITNAQISGDVVLFTDPPTSTAVYTQPIQDKVVNQGRAVGWAAGVPIYDFFGWKGSYAPIFATAAYGSDTVHLAIRGQKRLKANQMFTLAKRVCLAA